MVVGSILLKKRLGYGPKTTLTKEDEKELQRMTQERARSGVDTQGQYVAARLRKRIPVGESGWNKGGRRRSRRKRRRSRRRRKRRKRRRRRTRRKRRRRRTRRKRGGAPKWLDGVDKEYIFKEGGTWFLLRDKEANLRPKRPANTYPHLHGGPNWLNCTFAKGDHDEIWSVGMEGYKKGSLDDLKKNIAGKGPKPLGLNASAGVEWKKVVTNMKALGAGGGGGGSGVRSSSPRHRGGPVAMSFKPVTEGEILGKKSANNYSTITLRSRTTEVATRGQEGGGGEEKGGR